MLNKTATQVPEKPLVNLFIEDGLGDLRLTVAVIGPNEQGM